MVADYHSRPHDANLDLCSLVRFPDDSYFMIFLFWQFARMSIIHEM